MPKTIGSERRLPHKALKLYQILKRTKLAINALPVADGRIHLSKDFAAELRAKIGEQHSSNFHRLKRELAKAGRIEVEPGKKGRGAGQFITVL